MGTRSAVEKAVARGDEEIAVAAARQAVSQRLIDSLLHDVRNPLNALSINLDVLTEKIRREQGEIPATQEKNLKVMREQIFRVDGILKQFAEFMFPRPDAAPATLDLSDVVRQVLGVLGHECRRAMIKVRQMVEPDLRVRALPPTVRFIVVQVLLRAIVRAGQEGEVDITLQRDGDRALLRIKDSAPEMHEPFVHASVALTTMCAECSAELRLNVSEVQLQMPLA